MEVSGRRVWHALYSGFIGIEQTSGGCIKPKIGSGIVQKTEKKEENDEEEEEAEEDEEEEPPKDEQPYEVNFLKWNKNYLNPNYQNLTEVFFYSYLLL